MRKLNFFTLCILFVLVIFQGVAARSAFAVDILQTARDRFFNTLDPSRVGIEVEFRGLTAEQSAKLLAKKLNGTVTTKMVTQKTSIKETLADGSIIYNEVTFPEYIVKDSRVGNLTLKTDLNMLSDTGKVDLKKAVVELVTEPIHYKEVVALQEGITALKMAGAIGTTRTNAVSTQVNLEIEKGVKSNMRSKDLVNLMRSYTRPEHRAQLDEILDIPHIRKPYLGVYSKGFMKRLLDPDYNPSWQVLYDDFVYRQSLERLKVDRAWTMPIKEARSKLLGMKNPIVPSVVKLNSLRVSSLLMFMNPEDPMSKLYHSSGWAVGRPLVEFREWNNTFDVVGPVQEAMGLKDAAKKYGYYDHDRLLYSLSGVDEETIQELRAATIKRGDKPVLFRYFLGDPKQVDFSEFADMAKPYYAQSGSVVGFLPVNKHAKQPLILPGESVVFHRRPFHTRTVIGKYNPSAVNTNLQQALENKLVEGKFWEEFAPGAMPETIDLADVYKKNGNVKQLIKDLDTQFPKGWVMKGAWDIGSERDIITDKSNILDLIEKYETSDFDDFLKKTLEKHKEYIDTTPEYMQSILKEHPGYKGYKIKKNLLSKPELTIVQERLPLLREFRVEVIDGKVLGSGSTIDRYAYLDRAKLGKKYKAPSEAQVLEAEKWAQKIVNKLPKELRGMPMGMDVAILDNPKNGRRFAIIESNPGGNSGYLFEEENASVRALGKLMKEYPEKVKSGKAYLGMTETEQMDFLKKYFKKWNIDVEKHYPRMNFLADHIEDIEISTIDIDPTYATVQSKRRGGGKGTRCKPGNIAGSVQVLFQ